MVTKQLIFGVVWLFACVIDGKEPLVLSKNFLKNKNEISCFVHYTHYQTDHFWNREGQRRKAYNQLQQDGVDIYAQYGLSCQDTLGLYAYYVRNNEQLNWNSTGVGDLELHWKHFLGSVSVHAFSSRLIAIVPVGKKKTTVRYGEWGVEADLHCQRNFTFHNRSGWYELLAGYRYYGGFPSDQVKISIVAGYQPFPLLKVIGRLYLNWGVLNGKEERHGPVLTLPPRYRLLTSELHVVFCLAKWISGFAGFFQHLWGENIGTGGGFFAGISFDL
jgi:hypothetical protein